MSSQIFESFESLASSASAEAETPPAPARPGAMRRGYGHGPYYGKGDLVNQAESILSWTDLSERYWNAWNFRIFPCQDTRKHKKTRALVFHRFPSCFWALRWCETISAGRLPWLPATQAKAERVATWRTGFLVQLWCRNKWQLIGLVWFSGCLNLLEACTKH